MLGRQSANAASHSSPEWTNSSRLTTIARDLVGYTLEEVERELILNSLDQYGGCRTYTAMFFESRSDACVTKLLNTQGWEYRSLHRANVMT